MVFLIAVTFYKLREEASDAHNFARDVQNNAKRDHDEAEREKLLLKQREVPLIVQRGLALCEQGDIDRGLQWLKQARAFRRSAEKLTSFDREIRANLTAWDKQLTPTQHIIQVPGGVSLSLPIPRATRLRPAAEMGSYASGISLRARKSAGRSSIPAAPGQAKPDVKSLAWSNDGKYLASAGGSQVCVWDVSERRQIGEVWDLGEDLNSLHFSADGQFLFAVSGKGGIRYRKTLNQGAAADSIGHGKFGSPVVCAPSRDGKWLATSGQNGLLRLWTKTLGRWITMQSVAIGSWVEALAWAGDDRQVVLGCRDGKLFVWDLETKMLYRSLRRGMRSRPCSALPMGDDSSPAHDREPSISTMPLPVAHWASPGD